MKEEADSEDMREETRRSVINPADYCGDVIWPTLFSVETETPPTPLSGTAAAAAAAAATEHVGLLSPQSLQACWKQID